MTVADTPRLVLARHKVPPHECRVRLGCRPHVLVVDRDGALGRRQWYHANHLAIKLKVPLDLGNVGAKRHDLATSTLAFSGVASNADPAAVLNLTAIGRNHGRHLVLAPVRQSKVQNPTSTVGGDELQHFRINGVTTLEKPLGTEGLPVDNVPASARVVVKVSRVLGFDEMELDRVVVGFLTTASKHGRMDDHFFERAAAGLGDDIVDSDVGRDTFEEEDAVGRVGGDGVEVDSWVSE